jgi:hypothetical protein
MTDKIDSGVTARELSSIVGIVTNARPQGFAPLQ